MSAELAPMQVPQMPSYCGPSCLSTCLYILGIEATQRDLARAAGVQRRIFWAGTDEKQNRKAAARYRVRSEFLHINVKDNGRLFAGRLRRHLRKGLPAMLLVKDLRHWVSVLGCIEDDEDEKFIIVDPNDHERIFSRWTENTLIKRAWNEYRPDDEEDDTEEDQYFAILLSRKDGAPARWAVSEAWLRLYERGTADTATNMANDLYEMVLRSAPAGTPEETGVYLADVLEQYKDMVIETIDHWVADPQVTTSELKNLYRDYKTVAAATSLRLPLGSDHTEMLAQISAIMTVYALSARL
ncbi:MAG: hypothetical protein LC725_12005 [Lentisphaerae bacterium]|nr:hypothetical protein [Lentisphaerota bacterium]